MSDGIPVGSVERLLHHATVDTLRVMRASDERSRKTGARELLQQFQIAISGTAGMEPFEWKTVEVNFTHAFFSDPAKRDSSLEYPQFHAGAHTNPPVIIHATVANWLLDETNGSVIGAMVAVAAQGTEFFEGFLHLTFQGRGALIEPESEFSDSGTEE